MLIKRLFDFTSSAVVVLIVAPFFLIIALWIKWHDKGPVFFVQERVGQHGKPFRLIKFRSMVHDPTGERRLVTSDSDSHITPPGHFLRKYKLDELPQLFNIVMGDMSVVGPRPEVQKFIDHYSEADRQTVLSVKPGLTDYAAIRYRNESEVLAQQPDPETYYIQVLLPQKIAMYKKYVEERTFWVDLKLIFATLKAIVI